MRSKYKYEWMYILHTHLRLFGCRYIHICIHVHIPYFI
jgi:hypothetical protein